MEMEISNTDLFHPISLLNVEGKIFFAVLALRLTTYLLINEYIDSYFGAEGWCSGNS